MPAFYRSNWSAQYFDLTGTPASAWKTRPGPLQQFPHPDLRSLTRPTQNPRSALGVIQAGEPCHLPSSAGNTVTMELATINDENPCGDRV
jgi:hypothetical protein